MLRIVASRGVVQPETHPLDPTGENVLGAPLTIVAILLATRADLKPGIAIPELARLWNVHPTTIRRLIKAGELDTFSIGPRQRITVESVDAYLHRQNETGDQE